MAKAPARGKTRQKRPVPRVRPEPYEEITHGGQLIAIILRAHFTSDKTRFFGHAEFSQQLGFIVHKKGGVIQAHFHKEVHRDIVFTQEVLFVRKGTFIVNFYSTVKEYLTSRTLSKGDMVFLCSGGHGMKMLGDSEIVEVKQGPYSGRDSDKELFEGVENQ